MMRRYLVAVPIGAAVGAALGALATWVGSMILADRATPGQYVAGAALGTVFFGMVGFFVARQL
jgi:hypothetical protein